MPHLVMTKKRPQNRHLRPNPEKLGVELLKEGERTLVTRIRGGAEALAWFQALSSEERGRLVEQWHKSKQ